ncbi:MAG: hypothetical protein HDS43_06585 [Bacteroides sp.]|nr:hypothetical protein [Bacteroides sp.]
MERKDKKVVIPTTALLSEMEALKIHGGVAVGTANPDGTNYFCNGAKCLACQITPPKNTTDCVDVKYFCGDGTSCG